MNDLSITHDVLSQRQRAAWDWAVEVYGERAKDHRYQAFRLLEETLEAVQTQGLTLEDMIRTCQYVAARRIGDTKGEVGDLAYTLDIFAENLGVSVDGCRSSTALRVRGLNVEAARAKDAAKVAAGIG